MRVLPDRNFKENYKKHYAENYEKLSAKREEKAERKRGKQPMTSEDIKYRIAGGVATFVILGCFFAAGLYISSKFSEKESRITELDYKIAETDELIKKLQVVNGDETREQIKDALISITDLQNQYLSGEFSDDFESLAAYWLGNYNNNWASSVENLEKPMWQGYFNQAHRIEDTAEFIFILFDNNKPVMTASVEYSVDRFGNLTEISAVRKMVLS